MDAQLERKMMRRCDWEDRIMNHKWRYEYAEKKRISELMAKSFQSPKANKTDDLMSPDKKTNEDDLIALIE